MENAMTALFGMPPQNALPGVEPDVARVVQRFEHAVGGLPRDLLIHLARIAIDECAAMAVQRGAVPQDGYVRIPQSADEAAMMSLLGESWLKQNAPERLRPEAR